MKIIDIKSRTKNIKALDLLFKKREFHFHIKILIHMQPSNSL